SFNCCVVVTSSAFILFWSISSVLSNMSFNCCVVVTSSAFILFWSISSVLSNMSFNCCVVVFEGPLQSSINSVKITLDSFARVFNSFKESFTLLIFCDEGALSVSLSCAKCSIS
ncbi:unnamed protein product, partial [Meganyctiphanes norvegica]